MLQADLDRVTALTGWLLDQLLALRHSNGASLVRVYGPTDTHMRGGTITVNFYGPGEKLINHMRIEELASYARICLRSGCFCNPGAGEVAHGLTKKEMEEGFRNKERMTFDQFMTVLQRIGGKSAGAVRISLGLASNFDDVFRVVEFARSLLDRKASQV